MKRCSVVVALLLLSFASRGVSQAPPFGAPFPLTNTRYQTTPGVPVLRSDGRNAFLFWVDQLSWGFESQLRVTRLLPGERIVARPVFDTPINLVSSRHDYDVIWNGRHFVVAALMNAQIVGRIVDATGQPTGEPFVIAAEGRSPRMAFNGKHILMAHYGPQITVRMLSPDGRPTGAPPMTFPGILQHSSAVTTNGSVFAVILPTQFGTSLLTFDGDGRKLSETPLPGDTRWAIASDGNRFLAVSGAGARLFDARGNAIRALPLPGDAWRALRFDAVWTGSAWTISFVSRNLFHIVSIDSGAQTAIPQHGIGAATGTIAIIGQRVIASWSGAEGIVAATLPSVQDVQRAAYAATHQRFLATTTSSNGTLVVWDEVGDGRISTRAGVRSRDGAWRESEIHSTAVLTPDFFPVAPVVAASDGQEFLAIVGDMVIPLDANGRRKLPFSAVRVTGFRPVDIAWNGRSYGVIGRNDMDGTLRTALLSPEGFVLQTGAILGVKAERPRIASDGDGFYAIWHVYDWSSEARGPIEIAGIHLDSSLRVVDAAPRIFVRYPVGIAGVAWNGERYVVAWSRWTIDGRRAIVAAQITPSTAVETVIEENRADAEAVQVIRAGSGVAILLIRVAYEDERPLRYEFRAATISAGGVASTPIRLGRDFNPGAALSAFPDGTLHFVQTSLLSGAPHHDISRLMMRVGSLAMPSTPDAPLLAARSEQGIARLSWSAPAQPVNGYRVEYRVGDGLWNEIESWLDPEQRKITINLLRPADTYAFRVRAFNDAGAGSYSLPAVARAARRRTVR